MLIDLTRKLIDIPSVSGEERDVTLFLATLLTELGYAVETQEVTNGRANIFATVRGFAPRVVFSSHTDTVPPFISATEDERFVYGRGACDTKGIIAAQITAAETLRAGNFNELGLLYVVDEELGSLGARRANSHPRAGECRYLINGEPTQNQLAIGSKGSLRLKLAAEGRAAHSAYPEEGESAVEKLLDALARVRAARWPIDDFFGDTTCNIGVLKAGTRPNVIAAHAEAELQIRLVTPSSVVKQILEQVVGESARVEVMSVTEPVRMMDVPGFQRSVVRFTTDVPHLTNWGEPLLIGPGSILDAHTAQERISKRELHEAVELYARLARTLWPGTKRQRKVPHDEARTDRLRSDEPLGSPARSASRT
ncbi:MAG: M20/M25/M40 family metallo-hydrolase [Pyrinomonadaceae bacterium]